MLIGGGVPCFLEKGWDGCGADAHPRLWASQEKKEFRDMKRVMIALTALLVLLSLAACSGENPTPQTPVYPGPSEPSGPAENAREFINWLANDHGYTEWSAFRTTPDGRTYEIEMEVASAATGQILAYPPYIDHPDHPGETFTDEEKERFTQEVFGISYRDYKDSYGSEDVIKSRYITIRVHDGYQYVNPDTSRVEYLPYYVEFKIGIDYLNPNNCMGNEDKLNRFAFVVEDGSDFGGEDPDENMLAAMKFVAEGSIKEDKIFEENLAAIKAGWLAEYKGVWLNPGLGVGIVELAGGPASNPNAIRFSIDPDVEYDPDLPIVNQQPTGLIGCGTFTK